LQLIYSRVKSLNPFLREGAGPHGLATS
jgi:hypothetical protein